MSDIAITTIDDSQTAYISYVGNGWVDQTQSVLAPGNRWFTFFHEQTYHDSYDDGDSMKVSWNGTGIVVRGTKRFNHGLYSAICDGGEPSTGDGFAEDNTFNATIYEIHNLMAGVHSLELINEVTRTADASRYVLTIDSIEVEGSPIALDHTPVVGIEQTQDTTQQGDALPASQRSSVDIAMSTATSSSRTSLPASTLTDVSATSATLSAETTSTSIQSSRFSSAPVPIPSPLKVQDPFPDFNVSNGALQTDTVGTPYLRPVMDHFSLSTSALSSSAICRSNLPSFGIIILYLLLLRYIRS